MEYFHPETRQILANFYTIILASEYRYESLRRELSTDVYRSNLPSLFGEIDTDLNGKISENELLTFVEKNGAIRLTPMDVRGLFLKMGGLKQNRG